MAFDYFKANASRVSVTPKAGDNDYHIHIVELHNSGTAEALTLTAVIGLASALVRKPVQSQIVILGNMSLGGNIIPVENLAESMRVALDAGARRILIPSSSVGDFRTVPGELLSMFQNSFYADPIDAVFKALGAE